MIDPASLRHILEQHALFKANRPGGRIANLSYIDLTEMKLEGVDLSDANLTGARLYGASLRDSIFLRANMFAPLRQSRALFMPPTNSRLMLRMAPGVEHFGQTGTMADLYRHHGIDANAIIHAAQALSPGRPIRNRRDLSEVA